MDLGKGEAVIPESKEEIRRVSTIELKYWRNKYDIQRKEIDKALTEFRFYEYANDERDWRDNRLLKKYRVSYNQRPQLHGCSKFMMISHLRRIENIECKGNIHKFFLQKLLQESILEDERREEERLKKIEAEKKIEDEVKVSASYYSIQLTLLVSQFILWDFCCLFLLILPSIVFSSSTFFAFSYSVQFIVTNLSHFSHWSFTRAHWMKIREGMRGNEMN